MRLSSPMFVKQVSFGFFLQPELRSMSNLSNPKLLQSLFLAASLASLPGCTTLNSLAGINSPTVPPPATGSYQIPGVNGAQQPYYAPPTTQGTRSSTGQWVPAQSRVSPNQPPMMATAENPEVQTVSYESSAQRSGRGMSSQEIFEIQQRLAQVQSDQTRVTSDVPGRISSSNSAQPLSTATEGPKLNDTERLAQTPLETPAFQLPTQASRPIGSGVPAVTPANALMETERSQPSSKPPSSSMTDSSQDVMSLMDSSQPTVVRTPVSSPPNWTDRLPTNPPVSSSNLGGSTGFRPRF